MVDLLFLNGRDLRTLPLLERKRRLKSLTAPDHPRIRFVDHIETEGEFMFKHAVPIGMEGVVRKTRELALQGRAQSRLAEVEAQWYHDGWEGPLRKPT